MGSDLSRSSDFDPNQLLAHRDFVRALARRLVLGDEAADELAQQTIATAWAARPEPRDGLRGWLAKVALRLRDRRRRDDERRTRRERGAAVPEAQPSAAELAAQIELEQRLAQAVARLSEPQRSTLFLRYWHDLAPSAIAVRDGVPVATVKSRLQRALAQLRAEMDAAHGGRREAWAGALIALAQAGGEAAMGTTGKVAVAAGVVLAAGLSWRLLVAPWIEPHDAPTIERSPALATTDATPAADEETRQPQLVAAERGVDRLPFASAVVVDPDGRPLADVAVVPLFLDRSIAKNVSAKRFVFDEADARSIARSDAAGVFAVDELPHDAATLALVKDGYEVVEWNGFSADTAANQGRKFVLPPAREIRGVARDQEGQPVERAMVSWFVPFGTSVPLIAGHLDDQPSFHPARSTTSRIAFSDASGRFRLPSLPEAHGILNVYAPGYAYLRQYEDELAPDFDLVLRRSSVLFDVCDAESGAPLGDATGVVSDRATGAPIEILHPWDPDELPDHQRREIVPGRLCFHCGSGGGLDPFAPWLTVSGSPHSLVARIDAPGYLATDVAFAVDRDQPPSVLRVALMRGDEEISLAGRILGADDARVEVRPVLTDGNRREQSIDVFRVRPLFATTSDRQRRFAIGGVPPGRYRIDASAVGAAPIVMQVDAPARDVTLAFEPAAALAITVVGRDDAPVPNVDVQVQLTDSSLAWSGKTGDDGTLLVEDLPAGDYFVGAAPCGLGRSAGSRAGRASLASAQVFVEDERVTLAIGERRPLQVELPTPTDFVFRVVDQHGTPLAGAELTIEPQAGLTIRVEEAEWMRVRALRPRTDRVGEARVDLLAGRHWVSATHEGIRSKLDVTVPRAAHGDVTIVVPVYREFGAAEGRVFELGSNAPLGGRLVRAHFTIEGQGSVEIASGKTDADGSFRFEKLPAGTVRFVAWGNSGADGSVSHESSWHSTSCTARVEEGSASQVDLPIARKSPFASSLSSVAVTALVRDAKSRAPLAGAWLSIEGRIGEAEVELGDLNTDREGLAALEVPLCDSYVVTLIGPHGPAPNHVATHQQAKLTLQARDGRLVIEADLEPLSPAPRR